MKSLGNSARILAVTFFQVVLFYTVNILTYTTSSAAARNAKSMFFSKSFCNIAFDAFCSFIRITIISYVYFQKQLVFGKCYDNEIVVKHSSQKLDNQNKCFSCHFQAGTLSQQYNHQILYLTHFMQRHIVSKTWEKYRLNILAQSFFLFVVVV